MDNDEPQYRQHYHPEPAAVDVREDLEGEEGMMSIRMPIASTGEVRNQNDDPLTRDELEGMARQIEQRQIGVFPEHGGEDAISGERYSQLEKMGYWSDAEVQSEASTDGQDLLVADARMPDPETLPTATGSYREALSIYKEQARRGIALSSSIGWAEDENSPGGNDLLEASIVGIGADPRTDSAQESTAAVMARAAITAGADPEAFVDTVRDAVMAANGDAEDDMSDDAQSGDDPDNEQDESDGMDEQEYRENMLEMQRQQTETLSTLADAIREDDDDEDEEDDDSEENEGDDEDDEEENSRQEDEDLRKEVQDLREQLDEVRSGGVDESDVDTPEPDEEQDADDPEENREADDTESQPESWLED